MDDAHRKAELYAKAAGVKLMQVLSIREATPEIPQPRQFRLMESARAVPIAAGELEFHVSIAVTYKIEPAGD